MAGRAAWLAFEWELFRHDPREWVLLTGDRILVGLLGLAAVAALFGLVVLLGPAPFRAETPVLFLLFALIGANFTLIAIVTSLSQFVLGRRLESPGDVATKIEETLAYREEVAGTVGRRVLPVKPDAFFLILYETARENLDALERATAEGRTKRARDDLEELVAGLQGHAAYVTDLLERPESGMKHALFTSLTADYENDVHRVWLLQSEYSAEFTDRVADPLDRLTTSLEHIEVASRMFKTAFIESEVSELSRFLLYVGLPVQLAAVVAMLLYTAPAATPSVPLPALSVLVPAILTAGFAPFLILSSYVIRLTVVSRRTADSFPFSSQLEGRLAVQANGPDGDR